MPLVYLISDKKREISILNLRNYQIIYVSDYNYEHKWKLVSIDYNKILSVETEKGHNKYYLNLYTFQY